MNLERIASLLSQNLKPSQVASIVGCSPARITQLSQTEEFKLILADKTAQNEKDFSESKALDAKYLVAEHKLIDAITEQAAFAEMRDNISALRALTERQYRKAAITNPVTNGNVSLTQNIVNVSLPQHALPEISVNSMNEVVAINEKTLAPLSSQGVTNLFTQMKAKNELTRICQQPESSPEASIPQTEIAPMEVLESSRSAAEAPRNDSFLGNYSIPHEQQLALFS